jgi:hypothetical protein
MLIVIVDFASKLKVAGADAVGFLLLLRARHRLGR